MTFRFLHVKAEQIIDDTVDGTYSSYSHVPIVHELIMRINQVKGIYLSNVREIVVLISY